MIRYQDVTGLTTAELERAKRELQANLSLIASHSPAHLPIQAHMRPIDAELAGLAGRAGNQQASRKPAPRQRDTSWPVSRDPSGRR